MIFTALAPRLIQSMNCNVHNKNRALKRLCTQRPIMKEKKCGHLLAKIFKIRGQMFFH